MCLHVCYQLEFHNLSFCKEVLFSVLFSNASVVRTSLQLFGIGTGHIKQFPFIFCSPQRYEMFWGKGIWEHGRLSPLVLHDNQICTVDKCDILTIFVDLPWRWWECHTLEEAPVCVAKPFMCRASANPQTAIWRSWQINFFFLEI
jgi:hypothetical protein